MGTTPEEQAALDRINQEAIKREADALAAADAARKAAEEAANNKMVAAEPVTASWPDNGFQAAQPGRLDAVKGSLGIGAAGDAAFASRLLNDGRPPAGAASAEAGTKSDGAKEHRGAAVNSRRTAQAHGI
jgi:hypothetical protein